MCRFLGLGFTYQSCIFWDEVRRPSKSAPEAQRRRADLSTRVCHIAHLTNALSAGRTHHLLQGSVKADVQTTSDEAAPRRWKFERANL